MSSELASFRRKLMRADEHRQAVADMLTRCAYGECAIIPEEDAEHKFAVMRIRLPKPPDDLSLIVGDFLFNARASLDYLVYRLVEGNQPNAPSNRNMFPICSSPEAFAAQIRGHRLDGVPVKAKASIERLQPYTGSENPLRRMADLHELDKHRTLNLVTAVASDTHIDWNRGSETVVSTFIGGEELRDGAVFGDIGIPLDSPEFPELRKRLRSMEARGHAAIFVAFEDSTAEELEPLRVDHVLEEMFGFIQDTVFPALEQFI